MFEALLGGVGQGLAGGIQSPPSGVHTGLLDNSSTNVVGNFTPNLGEILQQINQGSAENGGYSLFGPSAINNIPGIGSPSGNLASLGANIGGTGFSIGFGGITGIALLGIGALILWRRNK